MIIFSVILFILFVFPAGLPTAAMNTFPENTGGTKPPSGTDSETPVTNSRIVAHETSAIILELLDSEGLLRLPGGEVMEQPVYLQMNAPAGVREQITFHLMSEGVRLAAEPAGYHTLQIEWEPGNTLVQERGGKSRRIIRSEVIFSWYDSGMEIQKTWRTAFSREDEIPDDKIAFVEAAWNPAAFQETQESRRYSFLRRIAEPAVITGAVAVTIYLLYNVRR